MGTFNFGEGKMVNIGNGKKRKYEILKIVFLFVLIVILKIYEILKIVKLIFEETTPSYFNMQVVFLFVLTAHFSLRKP